MDCELTIELKNAHSFFSEIELRSHVGSIPFKMGRCSECFEVVWRCAQGVKGKTEKVRYTYKLKKKSKDRK